MPGALRRTESYRVPQSEPDRDGEARNNAGGFTFTIGDAPRLTRFLTLGTEGGTYYVDERKLTKSASDLVVKLARQDEAFLIDQAVDVSVAGRAPRNGPALFALAAAGGLGSQAYRARALAALPQVARTGGHLLEWAAYHELFRGWGPQAVRAVRAWYTAKEPAELAFQLLKYKQRDGWAQRDLIRLAHLAYGGWSARELRDIPSLFGISPDGHRGSKGTAEHQALFRFMADGKLSEELASMEVVQAAARAHATRDVATWVQLIAGCRSLSREMLPSEALREPEVWRALAENGNLGLTAVIRNLSQLTRLGLLRDGDDRFTRQLAEDLPDPVRLSRARVHPVTVLLAMLAYGFGRPGKGKGEPWTPVPVIMRALDDAFYNAFGNVEPSGKRIVNATDTSGSMGWMLNGGQYGKCGYPFRAVDAVAAMAMVTQRTEPFSELFGFATSLYPIAVSRNDRLDAAVRKITAQWGGSTDCAAPMTWALRNNVEADVFRVWTDNETWYGDVHPHAALEMYRQKTGIDARLEVIAVAPTEFSIADPADPRQLDVSGFDSSVPQLLADHARGDL